jgi:hypothetical protein
MTTSSWLCIAAALILAVPVLFRLFFAARPCWRCKRRPACISIGEYWVCRQCWGEVHEKREMLRAMFSDENVADKEIEAYFRERQK